MKENKMAEAIGKVNDKYINEALDYKPNKKINFTKWMGVAALVAAACLCLIIGMGSYNKKSGTVDSVVALDINPSIELVISKTDKVISAKALNEDAQIVLDGMDLKNVDLDTALNAIIGSLLKNGYLDEVYNAVNVCVENNNTERATALGEKVAGEISTLFTDNDLVGGVNSQFCSTDEQKKALAESYGISIGKLGLAQTVCANTNISLDEAVKLSISELWDLLDAKNANFITKDKAVEIALKDAGFEADKVTLISNVIEEKGGLFVYDIKFLVDEKKVYEYEIDAVEGAVIEREFKLVVDIKPSGSESEKETTEAETSTETETGADEENSEVKHIGKVEALTVACKDAGVLAADIKLEELELKEVEKEYHIEFLVGKVEYVYVIDSVTAAIISKDVEDNSKTEDKVDTSSVITVDKALALALEKAGVKFEDLTKCDIKYDVKKAIAEYKIHFHVGKDHYDYTVNAVTGEVTVKAAPGMEPVPPHETTKPVLPHEKEEATKPVPPHEKEEATKPVPPHEKAEAAKPAGPAAKKDEAKVTISLIKTLGTEAETSAQ